ncbi:dihydrofolate reductase family protein [Geodermatophilus sp. SYSU D01045]
MRDLVYYVGTSVDGFIAGPDDEVDFYPLSEPFTEWMALEFPDALPTHVRRALGVDTAALRRFDTVVMGRRTYDPALAAGITSPYAHLRQVVVSRSLESPAPEVTVVRGDPLSAVRALKQEPGLDVYLAGGGQLAGELLPEIDRVVVKQYPVVAGAGRPAFGVRFAPTALVLDDVRVFPGGPAVLTYTRAR